ncbi:MAG: tetratricopeptide repeat protein [Dysgonamonadaceae bacterium]|jgi:tetratricopeptide (TPR) repeat protein|nr:tetratricopeptide repeat protein [Dysgonamonadaceae bacterium]
MLKNRIVVPILLIVVLIVSCTSGKNTAGTRWYHSFNTHYNVYFNGNEAFKEALKAHLEDYKENYSEMIYMYPNSATAQEEKTTTGGPFDRAIEKSVKAIKTHSITIKPQKQTGKRNDPNYQKFMSREEYNPFLYNAWMLMAKSQFYNGDILQSASSFSYISRHYASQPDISVSAKLWQARCYAEMNWFYESEDILNKVNNESISKENKDLYASVNADLLIKQKKYSEAAPYLQEAIKHEPNRHQKGRMRYLLGQLYQAVDQKELAYKAYGNVIKSNPPYILEFNARIRQTEVYPGGDNRKIIGILKKMVKSSKNKDYLDQVYYALGNVYLSIPDTVKAVENYELGVEESVGNGLEKAFCQIRLGDIYFEQREYVKAQPNYSEALPQLKKEDKNYDRVSRRSEALDELIIHYEAVQLQDSLQEFAKLPESERLAIVTKMIEELKKKEAEEKKEAERAEFYAEQEARQIEQRAGSVVGQPAGLTTASLQAPGQGETFYFYSQQAVAAGKATFQQKWGKRILEDDWRRRNKANPMSSQFEETARQAADSTTLATDSLAVAETDSVAPIVTDPFDPQYYLQNIPLTEKDVEASNLIIIDGLYNMGLIYKDKLEDYGLSIESFEELNTRFPENENKLMAYYNLYLIYLKMNDTQMAELFKSKIREDFPESDFAIAMADPDYEYNIRMMDMLQDSIYQETYSGYLKGKVPDIRKNYELANKKYPQSKLMPKFMFLDALSYIMTQEPDTFKVRLKTLVEKYPDADVSVLAGEMLAGFQRGLSLASGDGNLVRGSLFSLSFINPSDSITLDSTAVFSANKDVPHMMMLMYPKGTINENLLLFTVAEYNFSNFKITDFDLSFETFGAVGMLQIKGFDNLGGVLQYWQMINGEGGYARKIENSVVMIPISLDNFDLLTKGKTVEEYTSFFETHFGRENAVLIEKWKDKEEDFVVPEETEPAIKTGTETDSVFAVQKTDSVPQLKTDSIAPAAKERITTVRRTPERGVQGSARELVKETVSDEDYEKVNEVLGKASETLDDVQNTMDKISADPVRGVQDLFKKKSKSNAIDEYVKQQEKEEKERQKQLKKEQEEQAKVDKKLAEQKAKEERELKKQKEAEEKALLKKKKEDEKEKEQLKKEVEKQKKAEKERLAKEKEAARKKKQEDYKAEQKQKEADRKLKEKQYKEEQKLKKKAQQEAQKQKEADRKAEQKRKDEERKAKQKAYEEQQKLKKKQREAGKK